MSRRVTLPGADELFRATSGGSPPAGGAAPARVLSVAPNAADHGGQEPPDRAASRVCGPSRSRAAVRQTARPRTRPGQDRLSSGRERHDEKITVYLSPEELVELEGARLALRQDHGLAVDRGRIVREALSLVLGEMEVRGDASALVRRLRDA